MKQDQTGKIWENNQMVGYIDEDTGELFGINPSTGYAVFVSKEAIKIINRTSLSKPD